MPKFKIGDIVRILSTANRNKYREKGIGWNNYMPKWINTIGTVRYNNAGCKSWIRITENKWNWLEEDLELVSHQERLNRKYGYEI